MWHNKRATTYLMIALMFDKSIGLVKKWSEIRVGLVAT